MEAEPARWRRLAVLRSRTAPQGRMSRELALVRVQQERRVSLSAALPVGKVRASGRQREMSQWRRRQGSDKEHVPWAVSRRVLKGKSVSAATRPVSMSALQHSPATQSRQKSGLPPFELRRLSGWAIVLALQASEKGRKYLGGKGNSALRAY